MDTQTLVLLKQLAPYGAPVLVVLAFLLLKAIIEKEFRVTIDVGPKR